MFDIKWTTVLTIATVLGGIGSLVYLYEWWRDRKKAKQAPPDTIRPHDLPAMPAPEKPQDYSSAFEDKLNEIKKRHGL